MFKQLVIVSMFILSFAAQAKVVVGTVNVQEVLLSIKQGDAIRKKLKVSFDKKKKKLKPMEAKFQKEQEDYQKKQSVWSAKKKREKEQSMQKMFAEIQTKRRVYQKEIQELEEKLKKPVLENIRGIIKTVSKTAKVDVTFETSTTPVLFAADEKSLTKDVIKSYDKKYGK